VRAAPAGGGRIQLPAARQGSDAGVERQVRRHLPAGPRRDAIRPSPQHAGRAQAAGGVSDSALRAARPADRRDAQLAGPLLRSTPVALADARWVPFAEYAVLAPSRSAGEQVGPLRKRTTCSAPGDLV